MFQLSHGDTLLPLCEDLVFSHLHLLMRSCLHDFIVEGNLSEYLSTNTGGSPIYLASINQLVSLRLRMSFPGVMWPREQDDGNVMLQLFC